MAKKTVSRPPFQKKLAALKPPTPGAPGWLDARARHIQAKQGIVQAAGRPYGLTPPAPERPLAARVVSGGTTVADEEETYFDKVLDLIPAANLIGYWPMDEASGSQATDYSGQANHGAYTGVTLGQTGIGDGRTCPLFDGVNDFNNVYSAALAAAFSGAAGTMALWAKVGAAGVWADATVRCLMTFRVDAGNLAIIQKTATENQIGFFYTAGATAESVLSTVLAGTTAWFHAAMTWSKADDKVIYYINGIALETDTALGTWAGEPAASGANIGCRLSTPDQLWSGNIAHGLLCNAPLSAATIAALATVG